jgi:hypothetical protein
MAINMGKRELAGVKMESSNLRPNKKRCYTVCGDTVLSLTATARKPRRPLNIVSDFRRTDDEQL